MAWKVGPRFCENEEEKCRNTQLFHLILIEPGKHTFRACHACINELATAVPCYCVPAFSDAPTNVRCAVNPNQMRTTGMAKKMDPRFCKLRWKSCVLSPAAGRRTQLFLLTFTEPGVPLLAIPLRFIAHKNRKKLLRHIPKGWLNPKTPFAFAGILHIRSALTFISFRPYRGGLKYASQVLWI